MSAYSLAVLAAVLFAYALVSKRLASTILTGPLLFVAFGLVIRDRLTDISDFPDALGQLLVMLSFFVFGNAILGPALGKMTWEVVLYAALSLTLVRIVPVAISMVRSGTKWPTVLYMGWFGPRGLASIVFAVVISEEGDLLHIPLIVVIMAATVGMSVLAHGVTAWLGSNRYADWYEGRSGEHHLMTESRPVTGFVPRRRILP